MVAGFHPGDFRPDFLDHRRGFVAEHRRQFDAASPARHRQVAVADPGRRDPQQHLARLGRIEIDGLDRHIGTGIE